MDYLPQEVLSEIFSFFTPPEISSFTPVSKFFNDTISLDSTWRCAYIRSLEKSGILLPKSIKPPSTWNWKWKDGFWNRYIKGKQKRITNLFLASDGDYVGKIKFFTKDQKFRDKYIGERFLQVFEKEIVKLEEDENIVRVDCRYGSVLHSIIMYTNKDRVFRCGGDGGTLMTFTGEYLEGSAVPSESWNMYIVVKSFVPKFYRDPIIDLVNAKKVTSVTIGYLHFINYLSFTFTDDTHTTMGALDTHCITQVVNFTPNEFISVLHVQYDTLLRAIGFSTNLATYVPIGRFSEWTKTDSGPNLVDVVMTAVRVRQQAFVKHVVPVWGSVEYL